MTATLESLGIDRMSFQDRLALVGAIWDSLIPEVESAPLTAAQREEIDRRLANHAADPSAAVSWEQVEAEALGRFKPGPSSTVKPTGTNPNGPVSAANSWPKSAP